MWDVGVIYQVYKIIVSFVKKKKENFCGSGDGKGVGQWGLLTFYFLLFKKK